MLAYSKEFRREVLAACDAGEKTKPVASRFGMSESCEGPWSAGAQACHLFQESECRNHFRHSGYRDM